MLIPSLCLFVCTVQLIRIRIQHDISQRKERRRPGLLRLPAFKEKKTKERTAFLSSTSPLPSFPSPPHSPLPLLLPRPDWIQIHPYLSKERRRPGFLCLLLREKTKDREAFLSSALSSLPFLLSPHHSSPSSLTPLLLHPPSPPG